MITVPSSLSGPGRLFSARLVTALALILANTVALPVQAETVKVRADRWYPFNGDPDSDRPGYVIEIMQTLLGAAGHDIDYQVQPWKRALRDVESGAADCTVGTYPDEAPGLLFPDVPIGLDTDVFITSPDSQWSYRNVDDLNGKRLGAVAGYAYDPALDGFIASNPETTILVNSHEGLQRGLRMLDAGRLDVFVESRTVFLATVYLAGTRSSYRIAGDNGPPISLYVACTRENPHSRAWLTLLDEGIPALRKSGELALRLRRYGLDDWESRNR
jgi:polar amino acid transport system substrate-binding protein